MSAKTASKRPGRSLVKWIVAVNQKLTDKYQAFLSRRPHRSFQMTHRRDYTRSLKIPGYFAFTHEVNLSVFGYKKLFVWLSVIYAIVILLVGGITGQDAYDQVNKLLNESNQSLNQEGIGKIGQATLLLVSTVSSGAVSGVSPDQQVYLGFALLMVWLTTVWLLREFMTGRKPRLRDGIYSAGAPIVATACLVLVLLLQLIPFGLAALIYSGLMTAGIASSGFGAMISAVGIALVATLVLYWITSTLIALVIVTLPGMYPMRAMRAASDLVIGRRLRILYRWLWAAVMIVFAWIILMIPVILFDGWIKDVWQQIRGIPIVPVVVAFLSALTLVWAATYVYLLYRKVVDDDAKPA